ncbi:hypothetical protein B0H10DRAFT_2314281 [Mycena sp. CBHHK59/15]|nr:hypothetical protein B0H10DRAFT_2314281 [Mycena sp. CBHHK59/15]
MAERQKRDASTARPGDIVNNAKQKRRTPEEIQRDKLAEKERKDKKAQETAEKKKKGVNRVAAAEAEIRKQDEHARATAARPDLVTAQLKRSVIAEGPREEPEVRTRILIIFTALEMDVPAVFG